MYARRTHCENPLSATYQQLLSNMPPKRRPGVPPAQRKSDRGRDQLVLTSLEVSAPPHESNVSGGVVLSHKHSYG